MEALKLDLRGLPNGSVWFDSGRVVLYIYITVCGIFFCADSERGITYQKTALSLSGTHMHVL